jgi:hypothetical protein
MAGTERIIFRRFIRPLFGSVAASRHFRRCPPGGRAWLPFSPAFLIMWIPAGFRFTCYYYRGAYYKAFWLDPVNCAVGEPRKTYLGERYLPLILQNVHRYFLYLALWFIFIHSGTTPGIRFGSTRRVRNISASASVRWS